MSQNYSTHQPRRWSRTILIALCLFAFGPTVQAQNINQQLAPREIARITLPSVVLVVMTSSASDGVIYGSGFFVKPDVVATNFHVIEKANKGYVRIVGEETKYEVIGVVGVDRSNDLALLKLRGTTGKPLPVVKDATVAVGDSVFAVGNPKGLEGTFSQGIISSIRRDKQDSVLQITAAISAGSSGGPVLDASGRVIGVAVGAIEGGESLNFAIPASYLAELLTREAKLVPLYVAGRAGLGDSMSGRLRPRIAETPNIRKPLDSPRVSFKKPDLIDGLPDHRCVGQVSVIETSRHKFVEKFGKWEITPAWETERVVLNEFGNIESEEGYNYKDFYGIQAGMTSPDKFEPSRYKELYKYDYDRQQLTKDLYWAPLTEKIFEYRSRDIEQYKNGERAEASSYNTDGSLQNKTVELQEASGKKISTWFGADGSKWSSTVTYTDTSGEVVEDYDKDGKMTRAYRTTTSTTPEGIVEVLYFYYFSPDFYADAKELTPSRTVILRDPKTGLELENTSYSGAQAKEHRKTEYAFDETGNWIRQTEYKEVTRFGRTYFEPQTAVLRKITYRQAQPTSKSPRAPRRREP
jgi:hypothetical protein